MIKVRTGQARGQMTREAFRERFEGSFFDPAFDKEREAIGRIEAIAWDAYSNSRKAPRTAKAGPEFVDPDYDLSVEWRATRDSLLEAGRKQRDGATPSRVLVIVGADRNDGSCPGEMSKAYRLASIARDVLVERKLDVDLLDLSS
jgi:hypothetical protein